MFLQGDKVSHFLDKRIIETKTSSLASEIGIIEQFLNLSKRSSMLESSF